MLRCTKGGLLQENVADKLRQNFNKICFAGGKHFSSVGPVVCLDIKRTQTPCFLYVKHFISQKYMPKLALFLSDNQISRQISVPS